MRGHGNSQGWPGCSHRPWGLLGTGPERLTMGCDPASSCVHCPSASAEEGLGAHWGPGQGAGMQGTRHTGTPWTSQPPPSRAPLALWQGLCPRDWTWLGWTLGKGFHRPVSERASAATQALQTRRVPIRAFQTSLNKGDTAPRAQAAPPGWGLGHRAGQARQDFFLAVPPVSSPRPAGRNSSGQLTSREARSSGPLADPQTPFALHT